MYMNQLPVVVSIYSTAIRVRWRIFMNTVDHGAWRRVC